MMQLKKKKKKNSDKIPAGLQRVEEFLPRVRYHIRLSQPSCPLQSIVLAKTKKKVKVVRLRLTMSLTLFVLYRC